MLRRVLTELRRSLIAGLVTVLPVVVTVWVLWTIWDAVSQVRLWLVETLQLEGLTGWSIPGLELVLVLVMLGGIGAFTRNFVGRRVVRWTEAVVARVPLVSSLYAGLKQLTEALMTGTGDFRGAVLLEYPRRGVWVIGFRTGSSSMQGTDGVPMANVFVPTTPNPTSGFYVMVDEADVRDLEMSVEEASKLIMSAGIVAPDAE